MSCSVKISSKGWAGSQRKIGSLPEETASVYTGQVTSGNTSNNLQPTLIIQQQQQNQQQRSGQPPRQIKSIAAKKGEDAAKLLKYIDDNVIGKGGTFFGPFGRRKVVYCDYTASGRSLQFLEDYIVKEVLPCLGDTRASTSICSLQSSLFRHEARDIVRHAVNANDQDAVLFTGHGTEDALRVLLRHLDLPRRPAVVFVGPFEHHANLRPWREHGSKVVRITETKEGFLDLNDLERKLIEERTTGMMVGYFSAASCITGVLADDVATTLLLHQYGALSIWDYTSAAPYIHIDMNPHLPGVGETAVHKDAIIFSGHKFMGGAQSPGVLVIKKLLLGNEIASEDMRDSHRHLQDPELRDESGTAGVVESIRCGLAVQLKENVTPQAIITRQDKICRQMLAHVRTIPELILLGNTSHNVKRLPIFSFMVRHPRGTFLHHNFVCAILNDVFGIQARGGCACAGRYAHDLMGIDTDLARQYETVLVESDGYSHHDGCDAEALRPGFARLSLPYFMSDAELAFVLEALKMVATEGWKLLPQYVLNPDTGEWRHHTNSVFKERKWLGAIRYTDGKMITSERRVSGAGGVFPQSCSDCLQTARNIFNRSRKMAHRYPLQIDRSVSFSEKGDSLRWFILPGEAQDLLLGNSQNVKQDIPFDPMSRKTYSSYLNTHLGNSHSASSIRRLNSDIPKSGNTSLVSMSSPRHHSLPALSVTQTNNHALIKQPNIDEFSGTSVEALGIDDHDFITKNKQQQQLHKKRTIQVGREALSSAGSSRAGSPSLPIEFAVGEAVSSPMILGASPAVARLMADEQNLNNGITRAGRVRCNSLESSISGKTLPMPIPLSPQTLASLGIANSSGNHATRTHRHCSCSSRSSLDFDGPVDSSIRSSSLSSVTSSPTSSTSPSPYPYTHSNINCQQAQLHHHHHHYHHHNSRHSTETNSMQKIGRSSPILSSFSNSSEDDLRAYLTEVTNELATEIKSEIREVISKVDDVLSESNVSDNGTPQHHLHRVTSASTDKHTKDDSFSASEIAEYLMEFSKEMASEVKSEIRCMVNSVDGLGRYSPDIYSRTSSSTPGYGTPEKRSGDSIFPTSPLASHKASLTKTTKLNDLIHSQQDSKMSSECSSDETVIYVVGPKKSVNQTGHERSKTSDEEEDDDEEEEEHTNKQLIKNNVSTTSVTITKNLPEIYSAINSVSSQDSGINLSFHDSDIRTTDLGRSSSSSSSSGSSSTESCSSTTSRRLKTLSTNIKRRERDERLPNDVSEDEIMREEEQVLLSEEDDKPLEAKIEQNDTGSSPQWHSPTKNVWKPTMEAIHEYDMIRNKDRILVCLPASTVGVGGAAGQYSLALLHTLHQYQFYARSKNIEFDIGAVTIDAGNSYDSLKSMSYLKTLEIPYFYEEAEEQAELINTNKSCLQSGELNKQVCTLCGRVDDNTRKRLYSVANRYGYNVLALGQHLDNFAEGFLSSLFYTGKIKTMKAHYYVKKEEIRVIRPFVYVRERALQQFTDEKKLPKLRANCELCDENSLKKLERNRELLAQQERTFPKLYWSLRTALRPLILSRGNCIQTTGHQNYPRQRFRTKGKTTHINVPILPVTASSLELEGSETDEEQIL
ncbi:hypothetical protein HCN44_003692 [Aphidius gifuensis]|uniref:Aminotransferase class V domain-containing protein n=1 Tax=Aphidius gifuensis TaxID=684658 RepID=A0A835CLY5_APHGI|nr:uncharacterized protein LOC122858776 [Aphidius gifuensis]KAF7987829.1 hypothetical protein HCN44_003692 [Aphidius gifuensis]